MKYFLPIVLLLSSCDVILGPGSFPPPKKNDTLKSSDLFSVTDEGKYRFFNDNSHRAGRAGATFWHPIDERPLENEWMLDVRKKSGSKDGGSE